jgi:hypothetical protein
MSAELRMTLFFSVNQRRFGDSAVNSVILNPFFEFFEFFEFFQLLFVTEALLLLRYTSVVNGRRHPTAATGWLGLGALVEPKCETGLRIGIQKILSFAGLMHTIHSGTGSL